jgi:hypothetical protein
LILWGAGWCVFGSTGKARERREGEGSLKASAGNALEGKNPWEQPVTYVLIPRWVARDSRKG